MNYYEQIKGLLISNEVLKRIKEYSKNRSDVETYYNVGKLIVDAQGSEVRAKYGEHLVKDYSNRLTIELKDKKYSYRNLMNMRRFYLKFRSRKLNAMRSQLSWSHYREVLSIDDENEVLYYIDVAIFENLSYRELITRIKSQEYKRLSGKAKAKMIHKDKIDIDDFVKSPIFIKNNKHDDISENILKSLILEDIESFMKELGASFSFIGSEYKIKVGNVYNYIDLLLFNIDYNCYVVIELKIVELKKEHIGQIQVYMNYIDEKVKGINHNKTIGIIICKQDNNYIIKYCSDKRIISREYKLI